MRSIDKVLVAGAAGYVGSMLVRELLAGGHEVVAVDCMHFGDASLTELKGKPRFTLLDMDIRHLGPAHFNGVSAVVDLTGISSIPAAALDARHTDEINHLARVRLAELAESCGAIRHVQLSSSSVYGNTGQDVADETSPLNPLNEYSHACVQAEQQLLAMKSARFCPVVLRPGTVYGLSPRMRLDLIVNRMTLSAVRDRTILLHGGGLQWRPHVHVRDLVRAIMAAVRVSESRIGDGIFNISHSNLRAVTVASMVREVIGSDVRIVSDGGQRDPASYRLDCMKARQMLGWRHYESICSGTYEVAAALNHGLVQDGPATDTLLHYQQLGLGLTGHGCHMVQ